MKKLNKVMQGGRCTSKITKYKVKDIPILNTLCDAFLGKMNFGEKKIYKIEQKERKMKQTKYNKARLAVDDAVVGRLKKLKRLYNYHNVNELLTDILDNWEYNIPFGQKKGKIKC